MFSCSGEDCIYVRDAFSDNDLNFTPWPVDTYSALENDDDDGERDGERDGGAAWRGFKPLVQGASGPEVSVWWADLGALLPSAALVSCLWGLSGVAHAAFLTGAPSSLMAAHVAWLDGITEHGLHLTLVGCKVWAAALCFYLSDRFLCAVLCPKCPVANALSVL